VAVSSVLALRALGLGDLLTAVPALRALRAAHRRAELAVACPRPLHELLAEWRLADRAYDTPPLARLPEAAWRADMAVNLHGSGPESTRRLLETRPGRVVAYAHAEVHDVEGPAWRPDEHEVDRWCRLLADAGIEADPRLLDLPIPAADVPGEAVGAVVLHPGAASPARRWPAERWAGVAAALHAGGRHVLFTGGHAERELCRWIAASAGLPPQRVLAGRTTLVQLAAVIGRARLLVCGDTGAAHLATALGTRSVLLFGPTSPARWGPPPRRARHAVLWSGSTGDPHAARPDPGLLRIGVRSVRHQIERQLEAA
jgi:ADP-heptose:LPS heptosyltransferase